MLVRTWAVFVDRGAVNPTFNGKALIAGLRRIQEYWAIDFRQDTKRPHYRFILTIQRKPQSWLAYTQGNSVRYFTYHQYGFDQLTFIHTHETGHLLTPGNRHARDSRNVMAPSLNDPYKNFHLEDPQWYRLSWKSARRPWNEPNFWRNRATNLPDPLLPGIAGHVEETFWTRFLDYFTPRTPLWIEE